LVGFLLYFSFHTYFVFQSGISLKFNVNNFGCFKIVYKIAGHHLIHSQLNGNNGEATNGDDLDFDFAEKLRKYKESRNKLHRKKINGIRADSDDEIIIAAAGGGSRSPSSIRSPPQLVASPVSLPPVITETPAPPTIVSSLIPQISLPPSVVEDKSTITDIEEDVKEEKPKDRDPIFYQQWKFGDDSFTNPSSIPLDTPNFSFGEVRESHLYLRGQVSKVNWHGVGLLAVLGASAIIAPRSRSMGSLLTSLAWGAFGFQLNRMGISQYMSTGFHNKSSLVDSDHPGSLDLIFDESLLVDVVRHIFPPESGFILLGSRYLSEIVKGWIKKNKYTHTRKGRISVSLHLYLCRYYAGGINFPDQLANMKQHAHTIKSTVDINFDIVDFTCEVAYQTLSIINHRSSLSSQLTSDRAPQSMSYT
jgi:hypothetical protein